ncbi:MAG: hypothetical protein OEX82_08115, partial [Nitrosomonas sp.]|nr:hypothetical protein [Nitrosomonas sp.]
MFDASQDLFIVEHFEATTQTVTNEISFDSAAGKLIIPAVDFLGATYRATLNLIPDTLSFRLESAEIQ